MNTILNRLTQRSIDTPSEPLYFFLGKNAEVTDSLNYKQTFDKALQVAAMLANRGLKGERCMLMYQPGLDVIPAFFGCLYAGVISVPAFPMRKNSSSKRIRSIIANADAKVVCTTRKVYDSMFALFTDDPVLQSLIWICTDELHGNQDKEVGFHPLEYTSDDLAYLQYTSGSTGSPKGVMVTHQNIMSNLKAIDESCLHEPGCRIISWMPVFHDMGLIYGVLQPIFNSCVAYIMSPVLFMQNPFEWLNAISVYKGNFSTAPNFAYDLCVEQITDEQKRSLDLSSWKAAGCAAEPVKSQTLKNFAQSFSDTGFSTTAFSPCYGLAEATLKVTGLLTPEKAVVLRVDAKQFHLNRIEPALAGQDVIELVGCGGPASDTSVKIVDQATGIECDKNTIGEIWVNSPSVTAGFWNNPEETAIVFNAQIAGSKDTEKFLRTGDLGFIHNGELFVTGRLKELIIIRGTNHYPQDIEHSIQQSHPLLKRASGAAFEAPINGEQELIAVFEITNTSQLTDTALKSVVLAAKEAVFQQHDISLYDILFIRNGTLAKTSSGKIERVTSRELYLANKFEHILYASEKYERLISAEKTAVLAPKMLISGEPQIDIAQWLVLNLAAVLDLQPEDIEDDEPFAAYGLDSSIAAGLTGKINERFGIEIQPTVFWEYSNIKDLGAHIKNMINEVLIEK